MSTEFASSDLTAGQLNAIVKKLGGYDGAIKFLQGKLLVSEPTYNWREKDGIIYLSVTSDGTTGREWVKRLESKGYRMNDYTVDVLCSLDFKPTSGVTTEIAILKSFLFEESECNALNIRKKATELKLKTPSAEVACLIRECITDKEIKEMGLWSIVAMHEPINDRDHDPSLLGADRRDVGCWLCAYDGMPDSMWLSEVGFAFVVSQVGPLD